MAQQIPPCGHCVVATLTLAALCRAVHDGHVVRRAGFQPKIERAQRNPADAQTTAPDMVMCHVRPACFVQNSFIFN